MGATPTHAMIPIGNIRPLTLRHRYMSANKDGELHHRWRSYPSNRLPVSVNLALTPPPSTSTNNRWTGE
jgi:hypothetical protein